MRRTLMTVAALQFVALAFPTLAEEVTYRKHIRPLWEDQCASCHGDNSPYLGEFAEKRDKYVAADVGPRMDTYADLIFFIGWPDTGAIMRRLDDGKSVRDGKPGNMYQHLGDEEAERQKNLKLLKAWVGEDAWTLKRWTARGDIPAVTKEELNKLKLKY
jgi:hypothetical protein